MANSYKCVSCGKPVPQTANKKHKLYCNDACRKAYKRRGESAQEGMECLGFVKSGQSKADKSNTDTPKEAKADNLEQCQYCGKDLPKLQQPRRYVGACLECSLKQPIKRSQPLAPHFTGKLTDYEAQHYKPASALGKGEFNLVSKPGRCIACGLNLDGESLTHCKSCIEAPPLEKVETPISSEDCE